jgi:hypothetical protein
MRTRTSFQKRQKEIARAEKQRDKAAKRMQKKLLGKQPLPTDEMLTGQLQEMEEETSEAADSASHQE